MSDDIDLLSQSVMEQDPLLSRVAHLTRLLRINMRELGLDKAVEQAAYVIPDTRERLNYVVQMTEQAATQVLTATETAQPLQDELKQAAVTLQARLASLPAEQLDPALRNELTLFLQKTHSHANTTSGLLSDIMMAQSFQDLTGQVIAKMLTLINEIESGLIMVLIENVPEHKRDEIDSLLNGPQISPKTNANALANQDQVDDLLSSLGF